MFSGVKLSAESDSSTFMNELSDSLTLSLNAHREELFEEEQSIVNIVKEVNDLREQSLLCDVVITVDLNGSRREFPAHKVILASSSHYFRAMFTRGFIEEYSKEVTIRNVSPTIFSKLLDFIYTSKILINNECIQDLMIAASMFEIKPVMKLCCKFLDSQLNPSNSFKLATFAMNTGYTSFMNRIKRFIGQHFYEVSRTDNFLKQPVSVLHEVLLFDKLYVTCESQVYDAALRWVKHDLVSRLPLLTSILKCIRCYLLTPGFISAQLNNCSIVNGESRSQEYLKRILEDLRQHKPIVSRTKQRDIPNVMILIGCNSLDHTSSRTSFESFLPGKTGCFNLQNAPDFILFPIACAIYGHIYIIGGVNVNKAIRYNYMHGRMEPFLPDPHNDRKTFKFNPTTKKTIWCKSMFVRRHRFGVGVIDGELYAVGGLAGHRIENSVEKYNTISNNWMMVAPMKTPRQYLNCTVVNRMLYAVGGSDGMHSLDSVERFIPERNEWSYVEPMITPRCGPGVVLLGNYIYAVGGYNGDRVLSSVERYNISSNSWENVASMKQKRCVHSAVVYKNKIYVFGGYDGECYHSNIECYDETENKWTEVGNISQSVLYHATVVTYPLCQKE